LVIDLSAVSACGWTGVVMLAAVTQTAAAGNSDTPGRGTDPPARAAPAGAAHRCIHIRRSDRRDRHALAARTGTARHVHSRRCRPNGFRQPILAGTSLMSATVRTMSRFTARRPLVEDHRELIDNLAPGWWRRGVDRSMTCKLR
jgi:hypothetical protein